MEEYLPFTHALNTLNHLLSSVCGRELKDDYKEVIDDFRRSFPTLIFFNVSITLKARIAFDHVEE